MYKEPWLMLLLESMLPYREALFLPNYVMSMKEEGAALFAASYASLFIFYLEVWLRSGPIRRIWCHFDLRRWFHNWSVLKGHTAHRYPFTIAYLLNDCPPLIKGVLVPVECNAKPFQACLSKPREIYIFLVRFLALESS